MSATLSWDASMLLLDYPYAVKSVTCPKCKARPGEDCQSTGGGNYQTVTPHQARRARIAGWTAEALGAAQALVKAQGRTCWWALPDGYYTATEAAATAIVPACPKAVTPRSVRLSEPQAERIEWAAQAGGTYYVSTVHFEGDATDRQSINALEAKGILRQTGVISGGYDRVMALTVFGWQVYRQHRLVIRRMPDGDAAEYEAVAREAEAAMAA